MEQVLLVEEAPQPESDLAFGGAFEQDTLGVGNRLRCSRRQPTNRPLRLKTWTGSAMA